MNKSKPKIVKRSVKHTFTPEEIAALNVDFRQSFSNLKAVEAEFDNVKAVWKAKTTEAESRMETLNATLQAGFDMRDKSCALVLDIQNGKKFFFLATEDGTYPPDAQPIITESLTDADRQQELIDAESVFEKKEAIEIFKPAGADAGSLTVGRLNGRWFSALKVFVGKNILIERLDGEQQATKKRPDAVKLAIKRFTAWVEEQLGKEPAKGFTNAAELVVAAHSEREE